MQVFTSAVENSINFTMEKEWLNRFSGYANNTTETWPAQYKGILETNTHW